MNNRIAGGIVVDRANVDVGHQVGAGVDFGTPHELHDLVDPDQAPTVDHFPHGVLGKDRTQPLGLEKVKCVGVAARKLEDLEPIGRGEWHSADGTATPDRD